MPQKICEQSSNEIDINICKPIKVCKRPSINESMHLMANDFEEIRQYRLHTWNIDSLFIYDIKAIKKTEYKFSPSIDYRSETIYSYRRLFIINGNCKKEFYEFEFETSSLLKKQSTIYKKYRMGICDCLKVIYSIGG